MSRRQPFSVWKFFTAFSLTLAMVGFFSTQHAIAVHSNPTGSVAPSRPDVWRYNLDNPNIETLMIDVEGNGLRDFLTLEGGRLYLRAETGFPLWKVRNKELDAVHVDSILTACNLDAQGPAEILAEADGDLWVINGGTMATQTHMPKMQVLGLTDLNGDGVAEIYTAPQTSPDPEFPPLEVYSLLKGEWTKLYSLAGCQLMRKPTQDAYQIGEKTEKFYVLDLDNDEKPQELLAALPAGKGWIGLGFDDKGMFGQKWEFTEIQDGTSRLKFLDWTDANGDTYYDILAYKYDTRRIFNSDVVSLGESIGSFPLRNTEEPRSSAKALKTERVKPGEWPTPHRDPRWTGRSPLKLGMREVPKEVWSYTVGDAAPAGLTLAELDDKPGADLLVSARGRLSAYGGDGKPLWQSKYLGAPRIIGFYDLDGDGGNEMLIAYRKVYSEPAYAVLDPATGKQFWEFKTPPYLGTGGRLQIGKFLPESKGLQAFGWGACGYADLTFFDFSEGYAKAAKPVWTQKPEHVIYPSEDICDINSDGKYEYILLEHSRLRIYDMATGQKQRDFEWGTYRSYGSMTPVKFDDDPYYKLLITSWNSMQMVEMVDINPTSGSLIWKIPGKIGLRNASAADVVHLGQETRTGDIDGDGKPEVAYLKLNESGDQKWHAYIRDLKTGKLKKDVAITSESFEAAGIKGSKEPPDPPRRPVMSQPAPAPAGSVRIVDAATGKVEILDAAGKVATRLDVPEAVTGKIYDPLVADLNGDGRPEIIIPKASASEGRTLKTDRLILQPADRPEQPPSLLRKEGSQLLLIFDRLQKGKNERLYLEPDPDGSRLVLKDSADKTVWTSSIGGDPEIVLQAVYGDFNGDGVLDVYLSFSHQEMYRPTGKKLFTINGEYVRAGVWDGRNGRMLWHASYVLNERPYGGYAIVYDVNGDGRDDILSINGDMLIVASGDSGKLIYDSRYTKHFWGRGGGLYCIPFVEDLDGDGNMEIYSQRAYGGIGVSRLPNEYMWHNELTEAGMYGIVTDSYFQGVADVDGDGKMEIGIGLRNGEFRCYAAEDGRLQWSAFIGSPTSEVCCADVDGDGKYEFLFGTEEGWLYAVGGSDEEKNPVKWKIDLKSPVGAPIVADLDCDGKGEILVMTGDSRLRCLKGR